MKFQERNLKLNFLIPEMRSCGGWRVLLTTIALILSAGVAAESTSEVSAIHGGVGKPTKSVILAKEKAYTNEAKEFIGKKLDPSSEEQHKRYWASFLITPKGNYASQSVLPKRQSEALIGVIYIGDQKEKILLLTESQTDKSGASWDFIYDAIDIPQGLELAGWEGEDDCVSKKQPLENIVAIGKWKAEYSKEGGYIGAYMWPIIRAWKIDLSEKKFGEIAKEDVTCINHNSFNAN